MKIVAEELEARERSAAPIVKDGGRRNDTPTASTLVTHNKQTGLNCCYCGRQHSPETCNTVKSTKGRKQMVRTTGRCYVCLKAGHRSRNCRSKYWCNQCGAKHHSSICEGPHGGEVRGMEGHGEATFNSSNLNPSVQPFGHSPVVATPLLVCYYKRPEPNCRKAHGGIHTHRLWQPVLLCNRIGCEDPRT